MQDIWSVTGAILASLGGASVIIGIIVKFTSSQIADALQKKYQFNLDKEMEQYKSKLAGKEYVSKAYFDREIEIYADVFSSIFNMVRDILVMIPSGFTTIPADKAERLEADKRHYEKAYESVCIAQNSLNCNAPFISEQIYDACQEIQKLCNLQLDEYENRFVVSDIRPQEEKECFSRDAYKRSREISTKYSEVVKLIRDYLKTLEIY